MEEEEVKEEEEGKRRRREFGLVIRAPHRSPYSGSEGGKRRRGEKRDWEVEKGGGRERERKCLESLDVVVYSAA